MNQRTFSEVILKILGITFLYNLIEHLNATGLLVQLYHTPRHSPVVPEAYFWAISLMFLIIQVLFSVLLIFLAPSISRLLFRNSEEVFDRKVVSAYSILSAAIPLLGLYFCLLNLPIFFSVSISWLQEEINENHLMRSEYGLSMLRVVVSLLLSAFLMLKWKVLVRALGFSDTASRNV